MAILAGPLGEKFRITDRAIQYEYSKFVRVSPYGNNTRSIRDDPLYIGHLHEEKV